MNRIGKLFNTFIEFARSMGPALGTIVAPLRSKDGTYGTQRMYSKRAAERRAQFPTD